MINKFKAVFFDMDGVIVDSMPYHFISWFETLKPYGIHLNPLKVFEMEGEKWNNIIEQTFKQTGKNLTIQMVNKIYHTKEKLLKKYFKRFIFIDIYRFIKSLKNQKILIGIVTGSSLKEVHHLLPKKLYSLFDVIITSDMVSKSKPDPEPYLTAAKKLNVSPKKCAVIENAPYGIKSAKTAVVFWVLFKILMA